MINKRKSEIVFFGILFVFSWSAGYNTEKRFKLMKGILESSDVNSTCTLLREENIDYVEIQNPSPIENVKVNYELFKENFKEVFSLQITNLHIYNVLSSCTKPR